MLEEVVRKEVSNLQGRCVSRLGLYTEVFPNAEERDEEYFIQISLDSEQEDPFTDNACTYLDYVLDSKAKEVKDVQLAVRREDRGVGLGRKLVEGMENVGKALGYRKVIVSSCITPEFWAHMGYKGEGRVYTKKLV